jgi:hypothetical protein
MTNSEYIAYLNYLEEEWHAQDICPGVRVERLQEISEADAKAEGMQFHDGRGIGHTGWRHDQNYGFVEGTPRGAFFALWRLINGDESLKENPWVWVVEFRRVQP